MRKRKTGPGYPLTIIRCKTHQCSYTLYPTGYAPYLRKAIICVAEESSNKQPPLWLNTIWAFILIIVLEGKSRILVGETAWRNYRRGIAHCAFWLGLDEADRADEIAHALDIPLHRHIESQDAYLRAKTLPQRSAAIWIVLKSLKHNETLLNRLLISGQLSGCIGKAWVWTSAGGFQPLFCVPIRGPP